MRAAAASMIPLISAVGHETDVTLIDFAADRRAPTPTAAAEMAVPVRADLLVDIDSLARRALASWRRNQEARRTELRSAARALPDADEVLALPRQRLDHAAAALARALRANAQIHRLGFSRIGGRLSPQLLRTNVERRRERYTGIAHRLRASVAANIETYRTRIARQRERVGVFAYAPSAPSARSSPRDLPAASAMHNCSRRSPIAACLRAALRSSATPPASRCIALRP